ncbi:CshA/CshB family fibrillar adhesin-related protein, partial [Streptococcus sp. DD11]|uniref:CshA/CshB family fibrillar adhesin-related protein n=1 Tax=Streptococcus sp. DD11 TaxID=1777879 RepID=UPI000AEDDD9A
HVRKFSIRKLNVGVCSVLLSTLFLLGTAAAASADEIAAASADQQELTSSPAVPAETAASPAAQAESADQGFGGAESSQPAASESPSAAAQLQENPQPASQTEAAAPSADSVSQTQTQAQPAAENQTSPAAVSAEPAASAAAAPSASSEIEDATASPKAAKPTLADSEKKRPEDLMKQITWLDFGDTNALTNLDADGAFQVGTVFSKEISPGYQLTLTVTALRPFNATEIYKKRVEGKDTAGTYKADAANSWLTISDHYGKGTSPKIKGEAQNQWSAIKSQGIDTQGRKTQLLVSTDSANYGVEFKVEAVYRGKPVQPTIVMADGEEANPAEFAIFTTNGSGWEYVAEWKRGNITDTYQTTDKWITGNSIFKDTTVDWLAFLSPDQVTGGLGSQVFGPNVSKDRTVPIVMTRGASEVGFYVASSGQQAAMMGIMVVDEGDAPESYGRAYHTVSTKDALT